MVAHFADIMKESDFVNIQAMDSRGKNPDDILAMADLIHASAPGKPIMVAHYKPDNSDQKVFESDLRRILSDDYVKAMRSKGIFAFSFMDDANQKKNKEFYETFILPAVQKYGIPPRTSQNAQR